MQIRQQMPSGAVKRAAAGQLPCEGAVPCLEREREREIVFRSDEYKSGKEKIKLEREYQEGRHCGGGTFRNYEWTGEWEGDVLSSVMIIMDANIHCDGSDAETIK